MSQRHTKIAPARQVRTKSGAIIPGMSIYGRATRAEMLDLFRKRYRQQLEEAEAALALGDDELIVKTYVGAWAQKNVQVVE